MPLPTVYLLFFLLVKFFFGEERCICNSYKKNISVSKVFAKFILFPYRSYCVPDKMPFYENTIISPFKERINGAIDSICAQNKGINYLLIGANFNFQHYAYGKIWMWSFMCPCYKLGAWILWPKKAILDPFSFG